jgi:hypothetical protein
VLIRVGCTPAPEGLPEVNLCSVPVDEGTAVRIPKSICPSSMSAQPAPLDISTRGKLLVSRQIMAGIPDLDKDV